MNLLSKSWIIGAALFIAGSNMMNAQDVESLLQGDVISKENSTSASLAFDKNLSTYYSASSADFQWVGLDLGKPCVITRIAFTPRENGSTGADRMLLSLFEGANRPDFLDAVPLYLIGETPAQGVTTSVDIEVSRGFRYVRYVGSAGSYCNVAELAFYGHEGAGDDSHFYQVTGLPTVSIHVVDDAVPEQKGKDFDSYITITYENGTLIQEYPILTRVRGNFSATHENKPYRIKFNDGKSHRMLKGSARDESPAKAKKWTLINNYGDKTLMRNCVAFEISKRLGLAYTPYCQPVDVILNGEYKGCYQLCDQISIDKARVPITEMTPEDIEGSAVTGGYLVEVDAYAGSETSWFSSTHGIPVTIKSPSDDEIVAKQSAYIKRTFNLMESALWSSNFKDDSIGYRSKLDVESFLRHFIVGELAGNTDTYWSTYMYKERDQVPFHVGPVWDFDLAMDNDSRIYPVNNRADWVYNSGGSAANGMRAFVNRVFQDTYASNRLRQIWGDMRRCGILSDESLLAYVDSMARELDASQRLNFIRWPILHERVHQNPVAYGSYEQEVNVLRDYFPARLDWMDNYLGYGEDKVYTDSVFYISSPADLIEFSHAVNSGANKSEGYLTQDIDMTGYSDYFSPIGNSTYPFMGVFDGRGHSLSNFVIRGANNCGIFGMVSGGAKISDFIFDSSCSISGASYVGVVSTSVYSGQVTIERVGNEAKVTGTGLNVAGILGCNYGSDSQVVIRDCYNTGMITGAGESAAISGWLGGSSQMTGCWNTGDVTGYVESYEMARYAGVPLIKDCYSTKGNQVSLITNEQVSNGELAWMLNVPKGESPLWFQKLGEDVHPVFDKNRGLVKKNPDGTFTNETLMLGDVQKDGVLTLSDADWMAEYIVGRAPEGFYAFNADVTSDKEIDVLDVVAIINGISGKTVNFVPSVDGTARIYSSASSVKCGGTRKLNVWVSAPQYVTAFQTTVLLTGALSVDTLNITSGNVLSTTHVLKSGAVAEGTRILGYSTNNDAFDGLSGTLLSLVLEASDTFDGGTISFTNQKMTTASGVTYYPEDVTYNVNLSKTYVTGIELSESELGMVIGDTHRLTASVLPTTATNQKLNWKSSDVEVVSVDAEGLLTAHALGTATITAMASDGSGVTATLEVTVVDGSSVIAIEEIPEAAQVYTLDGVRISKPKSKGIYVINGTKVLVK
ncbi:MAG: CotH kinase family protein [Bacteroidaceae bacterium]|nr:CotH kinase family protein [Bacteroidaceae bacterium]